jgi:prepilin-type N-terminal cleavage/methylation domain-containing protein/prepilin-type processing-associated H-X9-DG protein
MLELTSTAALTNRFDMRSTTSSPRGIRRAFTLVELLLVISIIAIVLALVLVGMNQLQTRSRALACLSNQRQLSLANQTYAIDNNGRLVSPRTDSNPPDGGMRSVTNCWVNTNNANTAGVELEKSLQQGALWSYVGETPKAYVSPMDSSGRVRSYSFSGFVGVGELDYGHRADDWFDFPDPESPDSPEGFRNTQFKTVSMSLIPQPSRTMATITEDDRLIRTDGQGYNFSGWVIEVRPPTGAGGLWIDTPALWNTGRVNISFMDGSVDAPNIMYEQLSLAMQANPIGHDVTETGSRPAFRFMASILLPGIIRPEIQ